MASYKLPRKGCEDCKFKNFIKEADGTITWYCKIFHKFFVDCERKVLKAK